MPVEKLNISLDPDTLAEVDKRAAELRPRSTMIGAIIDRYVEVCRRELPELSVNEWKLLCDSMNGVWLLDNPASISFTWAGVADSIRLDKLDTKWNVEGKALLEKLRGLSYAQNVALVDEIERFWAGGQDAKVPGE